MSLLRKAGRSLRGVSSFQLRHIRGLSTDPPQNESETIISIDRSGLYNPQPEPSVSVEKEAETDLARHLKTLIMFRNGPITLAEYMSEVLTNPTAGYYINRDVFGRSGDFITSPEISQMFGEMVGIWCVSTWMQLGSPSHLRIVEMGPGRGTLMADLLRGTAAFAQFSSAVQVDLVEVSPVLRQIQAQTLSCGELQGEEKDRALASVCSEKQAIPVRWHRSLDAVPNDYPTLYIGHEFIDALPVHQFQKTERGWCERLVDVASSDSPLHLRLVLSPGATPASQMLVPRRLGSLPAELAASITDLEVCPQGMVVAERLAQRISETGGAALLIDYGQDGPYGASLAAISKHRFTGLLESPGAADLSARVDFSALRAAAEHAGAGAVAAYGPITQASFLLGLGMGARLQALLRTATPQQADDLISGFQRLVGVPGMSLEAPQKPGQSEDSTAERDEGMGISYKALCLGSADLGPPAPFDVLDSKAGPN